MKYLMAIALLLLLCASSLAQDERSVLVNPPAVAAPPAPVVQPAPLPRQIIVFKRGLFGIWRATPMTLLPAVPVVVQPMQPTVIWTPQVIWR